LELRTPSKEWKKEVFFSKKAVSNTAALRIAVKNKELPPYNQ
jgi:hypothetical protein